MKVETYQEVYHGSHEQGLKYLEPRKGTHRKEWLHAAKRIAQAALYIRKGSVGGDFGCSKWEAPKTKQSIFLERFSGAFDQLYDGAKGSIYILPGETFISNEMCFDQEVISESKVMPKKEIVINNSKEYILELEKKGDVIIYLYPNRPESIPMDDEDIVMKTVIWARQFGEDEIDRLGKYQPGLVSRVRKIYHNQELLISSFQKWLIDFPSYKEFILAALSKDFQELKDKGI